MSAPPPVEPIEAGRYQIYGCEVTISIGGEGGRASQQALANWCRGLGRRLVEVTAALAAPTVYEPEAEDSLTEGSVPVRGEPAGEPPTSRPRLRSPDRRLPRSRGSSEAGARGSGSTEPVSTESPEELGAAVMATIMDHRPHLAVPAYTLVRPHRGEGVAFLGWRFEPEQSAEAFRAGVLRSAGASRATP